MTTYPTNCPVDGCDRGPYESENELRGHVNATGTDGHDWSAVQAYLGDDSETETTDEGSDEEADSSHEETDEEAEMPTQDEYEAQHQADGQADPGDGAADDTNDDGGGLPAGGLPMDPKTLGLLLGAALVLWLAYRALSGDGGNDQATGQAELGDGAGADTSEETQPLGGGLQG